MDHGLIPPRVKERSNPSLWGLDELLTFHEAAALYWPDGPLTSRSLRTAAEAGMLGTVTIARKKLTTRRQLEEMSRCDRPTSPSPPPAKPAPLHGMSAEEARAYMAGNDLSDRI